MLSADTTVTWGNVRSAGLEPAATWLSTRPVYQLRHERAGNALSPRLASNQLPSVYETDALPDELQGQCCACQHNQRLPEQDSNLHLRDPESRVLPIRRPGIIPARIWPVKYGRRDLNSHELVLTRF